MAPPPGLRLFQSTRPRGARRGGLAVDEAAVSVSIHAPAWGATHTAWLVCIKAGVSIHAPAWGATPPLGAGAFGQLRFNPRARVGRDFGMLEYVPYDGVFQSTRPRGARRL